MCMQILFYNDCTGGGKWWKILNRGNHVLYNMMGQIYLEDKKFLTFTMSRMSHATYVYGSSDYIVWPLKANLVVIKSYIWTI